MGQNKSYKIFFAIPFDNYSISMYREHIIPRLREKYGEEKELFCIVGNQQIGSPETYEAIETFKMQNSELFRHFVKQIRQADIIIADLTDNNPNVHVELGIALFYNKNILRVTRSSYERLAFDVRNYEIVQYSMEEGLFDKIEKYLQLFFRIKALDFQSENSKVYYHHPEEKLLQYWSNANEKEIFLKESSKHPVVSVPIVDSNFHMRDGKVQVTFEIMDQREDIDWFGVYLRVGSMGFPYGSILTYVRKNGALEIAAYPGVRLLGAQRLPSGATGAKTLVIELEGDRIKASIDGIDLECAGLDIQSPGEVKFASWFTNTKFWNTQIVCRDTIETFDKLGLVD